MAEFCTTEEAWKSPLSKEVKAWFPVSLYSNVSFFGTARTFSQTPHPDCLPLFLNDSSLSVLSLVALKRGAGPW